MATNLQLCQKVQRLWKAATGAPGTTPTTVVAQTGVEGEIVAFVNYAYEDIQNEQQEWRFRVKRGSFNTVAGTRAYTITVADTDFEALLPSMAQSCDRYILSYLAATGVSDEQPVWYVPYESWQQGILDRGTRPQARPSWFTIEPDAQMAFDPTPDAIYTIAFDYRRSLHTMTTDSHATTGTPILPAAHHNAIVWGALLYAAKTREIPPNTIQLWDREYRREMNALRMRELPEPITVWP
jgi:hypothetical protein